MGGIGLLTKHVFPGGLTGQELLFLFFFLFFFVGVGAVVDLGFWIKGAPKISINHNPILRCPVIFVYKNIKKLFGSTGRPTFYIECAPGLGWGGMGCWACIFNRMHLARISLFHLIVDLANPNRSDQTQMTRSRSKTSQPNLTRT